MLLCSQVSPMWMKWYRWYSECQTDSRVWYWDICNTYHLLLNTHASQHNTGIPSHLVTVAEPRSCVSTVTGHILHGDHCDMSFKISVKSNDMAWTLLTRIHTLQFMIIRKIDIFVQFSEFLFSSCGASVWEITRFYSSGWHFKPE